MIQATRNKVAKVLGILGIVIILSTMLAFLTGMASYLVFWAGIVISGVLGFIVCPQLRNESSPLLNWLNKNKKK